MQLNHCDVAIVSNLLSIINVHEVHSVTDDSQQFLIARSLEILKNRFGSQFVGLVENPNDLMTDHIGASVADNRLDVYKKIETEGWLKYKTPELVFLGNILYQRVDVVLCDLKTQFKQVSATHDTEINKQRQAFEQMKSHLEGRLDNFSAIIGEFRDNEKTLNKLLSDATSECELLRTRLANRDAECKRLARENAGLCESASQDTDTIIKLNNEIGKLREHIRNTQQTNKFNYLPDYTTQNPPKSINNGNVKKEIKSIPDPSYDMCIHAIKLFDKSSLRPIAFAK